MAVIRGKKDTLDEDVVRFEQTPLTRPVFVNSVPKSGTHLLRNILRMFIPVGQHYHHEFVQIPNLHQHRQAFDPDRNMLSCGHLLFGDDSVIATRHTHHILLVRDPHDWVLARARFHLSDEFHQANLQHLKSGLIPAEALLNMMIFGIHQKSPSLLDTYMFNAIPWLGTGVTLVRYEDIVAALNDLDSKASEAFFRELLTGCGIAVPADWKARVLTGSDRGKSRTARENLTLLGGIELPATLPDVQKRLVEVHAPGVRAMLGYA